MNTTTLQVPLPKSLKSSATVVAKEYGFSSLQEIVRVLLAKLARRELNIRVEEGEYINLTPQAKKRYKKMTEDFKSGRNVFYAKDVDDLMSQLHS